ncbi:MAG: bifunctional folylpolyglutamate synthase/dihydrofolate synthase, partial [Dehalococcoidia bacterium]|nr:bifunctional folylpolyglutamate synthase/dihydrofolate synthase [Dehalococcoidia bacterium]
YEVDLPLLGRRQADNAAAAIRACELLVGDLDPGRVRRALRSIRLPGRQEVLKREPPLMVDVAHTEDSVRALAATLQEIGAREVLLVFSPLADKRLEEMAALLAPVCREVIAAPARHPRAAALGDVIRAFQDHDVPVGQALGIADAVDGARALAAEKAWVVVAGSFAAVAEARAHVLGLSGATSGKPPA